MIPVTVLQIDVQGKSPFNLGRAPGSSIRGALYAALRVMYDTEYKVTSRDDIDFDKVGWLLRLEDEETSGGKDVPRPIAIRPPLTIPRHSSQFSFGLSFYGKAQASIHAVMSAVVQSMGTLGIGRGRQTFEVTGISWIDPLTGQATPLLQGQSIKPIPNSPSDKSYERLADMLQSDRLTVNFMTPTRIIQKKKLSHQPIFRHWFQRLVERIRTISEIYTENPVWIPFREVLTQADTIKLTEDDTQWYEAWSGSRRDGMVKPVSGFVGQATYEGDLSQLLPYILLGQALQVGKNTIKGCGWYQVQYHWQ